MFLVRSVPAIAVAFIVAIPISTLAPTVGWAQVEEIVVTTRRRQESLQEIPLSVTAISAEQIQRMGIKDLADVAQLDPSVTMDNAYSPQDTRVAIRGLSNTRGRGNVAFLVDGVDVSTENAISAGSGLLANQRLLSDVQRIEVVKGPQSALFGRSAFAGAISYTTKDPTEEFEVNIGTEIAEYSQQQLTASISGPATDTLGFRLDGVYWNSDGFYDNDISGEDVGGGDGLGGSGTLVWEPTEQLRFKSRTSYSSDKYDPRPQVKATSNTMFVFPENGVAAGLADANFWIFRQGDPAPDNFTGLRAVGIQNHGRYCPDNLALNDPDNLASPGYCLPANLGRLHNPQTGSDYQVTHSENAFGGDNKGYSQNVFRTSLNTDYDQDYGTYSFTGGYTYADEEDVHDQDYEAFGRPDKLIANWQADTDTETTQLSMEARFASNFDGPANFTVGYLHWQEWRDIDDSNNIIACLPIARDRSAPDQNGVTDVQLDPRLGEPLVQVPGICDGGVGGLFPSGQSVGGANTNFEVWQPIARNAARPGASSTPAVQWDADTTHKSVYMMLEFEISEQWKITGENRYVHEDFDLTKPNQASCTELGFATATGGTTNDPNTGLAFSPLLDENSPLTTPGYQTKCTWEDKGPIQDPQGTNSWAYISGSQSSYFNAPKLTLEWAATDDVLAYVFWAHAEKPAGINQLLSGQNPVEIPEERFKAEKMDAWELGLKTSFEAAGYWQFNTAGFYQDYKDKQVGTQVINPENGSSSPRTINASSAEVWGVEVDALWQPSWMNGLTLSAAYTWLDPEYGDFVDYTTSSVRAAEWKANNGGANPPLQYRCPAGGANEANCNQGDPNAQLKYELDFGNNDLERSARNAFIAAVTLIRPIADTGLEWMIDANLSYQDKRYLEQNNSSYLDEYWMTNVRFGLMSETWDVLVFVDNVFGDDTIKNAGTSPDFGQGVVNLGFTAGLGVGEPSMTLPDPRVIGMRANLRFGGE